MFDLLVRFSAFFSRLGGARKKPGQDPAAPNAATPIVRREIVIDNDKVHTEWTKADRLDVAADNATTPDNEDPTVPNLTIVSDEQPVRDAAEGFDPYDTAVLPKDSFEKK